MAKTTGKLKYDLSLTSTTEFDATAVYINKSAELGINGNANLEYRTIGGTYTDNATLIGATWPNLLVGPSQSLGKAYLYVRNIGPASGGPINLSFGTATDTWSAGPTGSGMPGQYDPNQFAQLALNEFAFIPLAMGASNSSIFCRAGYSAGSTSWTGSAYSQIEYMLTYTVGNTNGPNY